MRQYNHKSIEKKWQNYWKKKKVYKTKDNSQKKKFFVLDMFPYPSGEGLHVGHPKGYIATDVISRMKRMQGYNVLHPMGFDAFGLPAENYAIKTKTNPMVSVDKNVKRYKKQLEIFGFDYDWEREVNTTDPKFYKWTQWIFLKLLEKGLAYQSFEPINWCLSCKTGLANEDVEDGKCERCSTLVEKKPMRQWVLKITDYAEQLLNDLELLPEWQESIKESQRNWIGKSEGAEISFKAKSQKLKVEEEITVFTTRPDTLFGVTYVVLAPEHELISKLKDQIENWEEVEMYLKDVKNKTEIERTDIKKEKTGVEIKGVRTINPANNEEVPVWIADYVLADYGTGAVMAVPAHDDRDYEFAKKYGFGIRKVIDVNFSDNNFLMQVPFSKKAGAMQSIKLKYDFYSGEDGYLINSAKFSGMPIEKAKKEITKFVCGKWVTKYKLRDWVFSRQRYWGEPIPVFHKEDGSIIPVKEKDLPVILPKVKSYEPTGTGESPLANIKSWVEVKNGKEILKRETNTMPQWAGSSWYYLRYMDPKNPKVLVDKKKEKYWNSVDLYVGGAEHATRHLIYARFWHKFLYDLGLVSTKEPFKKLQSVGLIMAEDGRKMSKRWGNVVNPDQVIATYGADTLRVYEMFMGPFDQTATWSTDSIIGPRRFLEKVWRLQEKVESKKLKVKSESQKLESLLNKTIKKVGEDILEMKFNTAISAMMMLVNDIEKEESLSNKDYEKLLLILSPFAPHMTEELWQLIGNKKSIVLESWPKFDYKKIKEDKIKIGVQVNGKVRGDIEVEENEEESSVLEKVKKDPNISKWVKDQTIKKVIYIKGKIINIVVETNSDKNE